MWMAPKLGAQIKNRWGPNRFFWGPENWGPNRCFWGPDCSVAEII
jgi:hypothetical protein